MLDKFLNEMLNLIWITGEPLKLKIGISKKLKKNFNGGGLKVALDVFHYENLAEVN